MPFYGSAGLSQKKLFDDISTESSYSPCSLESLSEENMEVSLRHAKRYGRHFNFKALHKLLSRLKYQDQRNSILKGFFSAAFNDDVKALLQKIRTLDLNSKKFLDFTDLYLRIWKANELKADPSLLACEVINHLEAEPYHEFNAKECLAKFNECVGKTYTAHAIHKRLSER